MNSVIGMFRKEGFSVDLTYHVMHALGSRMWGAPARTLSIGFGWG
jgi:hypothetical protein